MIQNRIHFYVYTVCRYFLATMILSYAFAKILGTQFTTQPSVYDKPVGLLSGFELTWYYFGYSKWYGVLIAILQITSSILLFFRRTTRIGVMLFLSFIVNILLIDFAYDIKGAKAMASLLTFMALFVFLSEYSLFCKYLIEEPPLFTENVIPQWVNKYRKIKWLYIPSVIVGLFVMICVMKNKYMPINEFYGTWQSIEKSTGFRRLNFEFPNSFMINGECSNEIVGVGNYTYTKDTLLLNFSGNKDINILTDRIKYSLMGLNIKKNKEMLRVKYKITKDLLVIEPNRGEVISFKRIR